MINILVIGYGSIGRRHVRILKDLGHNIAIVSQQNSLNIKTYTSIEKAVTDHLPKYVIIANATAKHMPTAIKLANAKYTGKVLIEKPASDNSDDWPNLPFLDIFIAYNLRFHPIIQEIKTRLTNEKLINISAYCGQHLSSWRPKQDFRSSYSAFKNEGGGVLRDLSHELDYVMWFINDWQRITALGGNKNILKIDADEIWSILISGKNNVMASININYLDQPTRREIIVTTEDTTLHANLINNTLNINGNLEHYELDRDQTYIDMHKAIVSNSTDSLCDLSTGLQVNKMITAIENAESNQAWIKK